MFCPNCSLEDSQSNQFCRSCGTDLRPVRTALEKPDRVEASAVLARGEIGRAIAVKIQQTSSASELSEITEDILPEIERFLESPEEKRLRRIRAGSLVSFIGLGVTIGFTIAGIFGDEDLFAAAALGIITFFIGLAVTVNGFFFSIPKKTLHGRSADRADQGELDQSSSDTDGSFMPIDEGRGVSSVTENTTRHLKDKNPLFK